ncbi:ribonuclease T2 [Pseudaminobacter sp. 19-2017]|uniref:Ribonuclease T2 n=1 Tax=Pseudaminobacter soli (ex Zhang et al. 2022) TaxID=2831468 RepID=A0A942E8Y7_9HYPH|nr:ribonuclease T2 [Pseudaminobacter soli]MBS3650607.1 ribonuclease T2 [Pseudaminobacter soli]
MTRRLRPPRGGRLLLFAGLLLFSACEQQAGTPPNHPSTPSEQTSAASAEVPLGRGFDFYVLSLSWSPSYCEAKGEDANRQQCLDGRPYAFVVHGLWPQFERGYPENCDGDREVDRETLRSLYDIMPSAGLIRHEWRKHGTCSGLSQEEYFRVLRQARERVVIPPEFRRLEDYQVVAPGAAEASFLKANPGLEPEDMAVTCDKRFLSEVRICMTKQLEFRACPEVDRRACRADKVVMPPVRGG